MENNDNEIHFLVIIHLNYIIFLKTIHEYTIFIVTQNL